ncbi:MAG: SLBB domain-containing protein, partial [Bacteroidetes bacterium]|nr:SLBB domain-containing protein [Bacteroidota bacterium]
MKQLRIIPIFFILFFSLSVFAQDEDKKVPEGFNIENINPDEIPSNEELIKLGATEADLQKLEELRGQKEDVTKEKGTEPSEVEKENQLDEEKEAGGDEGETGETKEEIGDDQFAAIDRTGIPEPVVYGQEFFRFGNLKFYEKSSNVKASDNYILGPGDELNITIWGFAEYDNNFRIDNNGSISPKLVGRIYLRDMAFSNARSLIRQKFGNVFDLRNSKIEITLTYSRTITVNIVGEVFRPGSYTIPAINTAFNALIPSGGPNQIGSVRNIYIKRGGKTIRTLDVYEFLTNPDKDQDFFLQDNDYIYVPTIGKIATVTGEIKRPHSYELIKSENLDDLIDYAGGLTVRAYTTNVQIERIENNKEILLDLDLDSLISNKKTFALQDGDKVNIRAIPRGITNTVEVIGAVKLPGKYELRKNDKILDLIRKAEGVVFDTYLEEAVLTRIKDDLTKGYHKIDLLSILNDVNHPDNIALQEFDELRIYSNNYFTDYYRVKVEGAVRNPGTVAHGTDLTVKKMIQMGGGLTTDAYLDQAYIVRTNDDNSIQYIPIHLDTTNNMQSLENILLRGRDNLKIFDIPMFHDKHLVYVSGQVRQEGSYIWANGLTLGDVLLMSGGLKNEAANNRIEISRINNFQEAINQSTPTRTEILNVEIGYDLSVDPASKSFKLQPLDQIFVRRTPEYELQRNIELKGE